MDNAFRYYGSGIPRLYCISQRVHYLTNPSLRCHRTTELRCPPGTSAPELGAGMSRTVLGPSLVYDR